MKHKKTILLVAILLSTGTLGSTLIKTPSKQPVQLETAAAKTVVAPVAQTPVPVAATAPTASPQATVAPVTAQPTSTAPVVAPETQTEWWQNINVTYPDDQEGCMLSIIINKYRSTPPGLVPVNTLQSELDYATSHYPSICFAWVALSHTLETPNYPIPY